MKILLSVSVLLFLLSCGGSQKAQEPSKSSLPAELEDLSNEDFKPKRQVRYNAKADYHIIDDLVQDALKDESLAKIDHGDIKKIDKKISGISGLCYLGHSKEGLQKLDTIYPKYKSNPSYWNQMGSCYLELGKIRKAKIFYNKALSLNNKYTPAINNLGVVYLREGKPEKSLAAFKQVVKLRRNSKTAKYNMSSLFLKFGLFNKAEKLLNEVYKSGGKDKDVMLALAYSQLYRGNGQAAIRYLSKIPSEILRTKDFSLALFYAYKITKNKKSTKISDFLEGQDLSKKQRIAFNRMRQL
ncbi:MAG: hypothetical protein BM556_13690 [Bacteriovorax sp. MedPE-SWde]|nr:MAG: hypothetical protein BM556_13690 [Bacteriovorax sp. MedPE-SWde]